MIWPTFPDRFPRSVRSHGDRFRQGRCSVDALGRNFKAALILTTSAVLTATLFGATARPCAADDLLIRSAGKATKVFQVTKATYDEVSFIAREGLAETKVARETVKHIRFGDAPPSFASGIDALRRGDYQSAIKMLKQARTDPKVRAWWTSVWCPRHTAEAYLRWARLTDDKAKARQVIQIVDAVTKEFPNNFFHPEFTMLKIEASLLAGDYKGAASLADSFEKEVSAWKDKSWYLNAKMLGAQALQNQKLFTEAISKLDTLVTAANSAKMPAWAAEAQVRKAKAILLQGNKDKALNAFRDLVGRIGPKWSNRAAAAAYVGLGQVYLEHFDKPYDARDSLLKARVVYFTGDKKAAEVMAECAYWLGMVGEAVAQKGDGSGKVEAQRYYTEIVEQYKTTSWVDKAKQGLKRVN